MEEWNDGIANSAKVGSKVRFPSMIFLAPNCPYPDLGRLKHNV
jgi:hypothetical protein